MENALRHISTYVFMCTSVSFDVCRYIAVNGHVRGLVVVGDLCAAVHLHTHQNNTDLSRDSARSPLVSPSVSTASCSLCVAVHERGGKAR